MHFKLFQAILDQVFLHLSLGGSLFFFIPCSKSMEISIFFFDICHFELFSGEWFLATRAAQ